MNNQPSTEQLLRIVAENTGKRISLNLEDLDLYLAVAREAIIADRVARKPRVQLDPELKAALDAAAKTGATAALLPDGGAVFINRGHDYGDNAHLECTACGGSGHIDDQRAIAATPAQGDELPPLPAYIYGRECSENERVYTADQMRKYGAACRASAKQGDEDARDAARLDWLEQNHAQTYRFESTGDWRISDVFAPLAQAKTLREAIDAARTSQPGGK